MNGPASKMPESSSLTIEEVRARFGSLGFSSLTEIQLKAAPLVISRTNSLFIAPTGSGKTESAVIPVFLDMMSRHRPGKIGALYVTPLRALNRDVFRRITKYAHDCNLTIGIRHGDTPAGERRRLADNPPDILITTPETLVALLTLDKHLAALNMLDWVIIDEVHELLPSERGAQLALSLERLQLNAEHQFTRIGLSATVGNPGMAARFVAGTDRQITIAHDTSIRGYDVQVRYVPGTVTDVCDHILQYLTQTRTDSPVLLFTNTRGEAEFLASVLKEKSDIGVELHHGSLSREAREDAEMSLRNRKDGIVVCTSSLELGLDIGSVDLVIHYGSPRQASKLVQRIGRSRHNRGMSARGLVITNSADDEVEAKAILERISENITEEQNIHKNALDVLAHHLAGLAMQLGSVSCQQAYGLVRQAWPFADLGMDEMMGVLALLDANHLVSLAPDGASYSKKGGTFLYYYQNLSTIPDILKFRVFDTVSKKIIGTLDQRFVGDNGDPGNVFVLKGSHWRIIGVDEKSQTVNVEMIRHATITVPYWEGQSIPVDYGTASRVGQFRRRIAGGNLKVSSRVIPELEFEAGGNIITAESVRTEDSLVLHCCFGTRINSTLAALLSSMISSQSGYAVETRSDAYRIVLTSRVRMTLEMLQGVLSDTYDLPGIVAASLSGTHNINWRTWCVAKKFGVVKRNSTYERKSARFLYDRYKNTPIVTEALRELFHDKYDIAGTEAVLDRLRTGDIRIDWHQSDSFSKLAEPVLDHTAKYYSHPHSMDKGILEMVRLRLFKTKHRLVCVRCGMWERLVQTDEAGFAFACPRCKARQITATYYADYDLPKIVRKSAAGKKLTAEEKRRYERAWKVSSLVESFGSTALLVMSGYGIGADTAARILRNMVDEETLLQQIYEAERQYVMTRGFWDY